MVSKECAYNSFMVFKDFFCLMNITFTENVNKTFTVQNPQCILKSVPGREEKKWWLWRENAVRLTENSTAETFNNKI